MPSNDVLQARKYAAEAKVAAATAKVYSEENSSVVSEAQAYAEQSQTYSEDSSASASLANQYYEYTQQLSGWFVGSYSSAPTTRADGSALQVGDMYKNTTDNGVYSYNSDGTWSDLVDDAAKAKEYYNYGVENYEYIAELTAENYDLTAELVSNTGFQWIGQASSYAVLKTITPGYAGQSILLKSYNDGWAALKLPPRGGDEFVAINESGTDDNGTICVVSDEWYWLRVTDDAFRPEMFGAWGDGSHDDTTAIQNCLNAAVTAGIDEAIGRNKYLISSQITIPVGFQASPSNLSARFGFSLSLNVVMVDSTKWESLPDEWWNATSAFIPASGLENLNFNINQFDGGGLATCISTYGSTLSTSHINVGQSRNHIIVFRNYDGQVSQGTMNYISGRNWQDGYMGALVGGTPGATSNNGECHNFDVQWCANHRYGGISLQDRSQYSHVKGGTYDFNGKWLAKLTLTNASDDTGYNDIKFGDTVTNGTVSAYVMSSIMNDNGEYILMVQEPDNKLDGSSQFTAGDTLSWSTWTATISAADVCSDVTYTYFDIIVSNRSGDFSKCTIMPTYLGGIVGHNLFTDVTICPNSSATIDAVNFRGLGITGGSQSSFWYLKHLYDETIVFGFYQNNMTIGVPVQISDNYIYGQLGYFSFSAGDTQEVLSFGAASSELYPKVYDVYIASSQAGQSGRAVVRVGATAATVSESSVVGMQITASDLTISVYTTGADSIITANATRRF